MVNGDCARCPSGPRGCDGCIVSVLSAENMLVDELSEESCGFVLAPEVRSAIEVLMEVGMVSTVEIVAADSAA